MSSPMVSICSITYNQAPFIRQCLDGFLMQQCNFSIEIIINDDCSTDGTTEIIREYAEKYPDKIFPIFHEENLYSQGVRGMFLKFVFPKARGKYIALCEGDDYWTDPLKLQKQVDFLESHPEYSICYHKVAIVNADASQVKGYFPDWLPDKPATFELRDMENRNIIQTNSVVYRWRFHDEKSNDVIWPGVLPVDWLLHLVHAVKGKTYYMPEVMGAYRHHDGGIWSLTRNNEAVFYQRQGYAIALFYKNARAVTPLRFDRPLRAMLENLTRVCLLEWNMELLSKTRELFPEEMQDVLQSYVGKDNNKKARFARLFARYASDSTFLYRSSRLLLQLYRLITRK